MQKPWNHATAKTMTERGKLKIDDILSTVASYYGVECEAITSERRNKTLAHARHVAMYLSRMLTQHSLPEISRTFNRDHTVVLHAVRKIEALLQSDEVLKADIELLLAKFSEPRSVASRGVVHKHKNPLGAGLLPGKTTRLEKTFGDFLSS